MKSIFTALFLVLSLTVLSQTPQIDSLKKRLQANRDQDTSRAFDLNELAWQYLDYSIDSSAVYARRALGISSKISYINGIAEAKNTLGITYRFRNQPHEAIRLYREVIDLRQRNNQKDRLAGTYSNLAAVYFDNREYALALQNFQKGYDNAVHYGQEDKQLVLLNNIGLTYQAIGLYEQALESFRKGLEMNKKQDDELTEALLYQNISLIYDERQMYRESVEYNLHAYKILKKKKQLRNLSLVVHNLTIVTREYGDLAATKRYLLEMENIAKELNDDDYYSLLAQTKANYCLATNSYADALTEVEKALSYMSNTPDDIRYSKLMILKSQALRFLRRFDEALIYAEKALQIVQRMEARDDGAYMNLYELYKSDGDFKKALFYFEKAAEVRERVSSDKVDNQIAALNSLNKLDLKDKQIELGKKEHQRIQMEKGQQFIQLVASIIIGMLILILLIFSRRAYRAKQKAHEQLDEQKQEIERQKAFVEEKQTEILGSIHYAKRIQSTLLANESLIQKYIPESFISFCPKDIVSGDFYWATERNNCFYLAVCDSTGHGVPGAFMSLLNISFLNEAINEKAIREPHEILNHVRDKLITSISQDGARDGMEGVLLCFDLDLNTITYAASYNKPILVSKGKAQEFPTDKIPIGKGERADSFTLYHLPRVPGSMIYLYTDGYADQFGGPSGKKFKHRQLEELLVQNADQPIEEQHKQLDIAFKTWQNTLEQVDDVTVMGIRIS